MRQYRACLVLFSALPSRVERVPLKLCLKAKSVSYLFELLRRDGDRRDRLREVRLFIHY